MKSESLYANIVEISHTPDIHSEMITDMQAF